MIRYPLEIEKGIREHIAVLHYQGILTVCINYLMVFHRPDQSYVALRKCVECIVDTVNILGAAADYDYLPVCMTVRREIAFGGTRCKVDRSRIIECKIFYLSHVKK